jgi:hypothetical protein
VEPRGDVNDTGLRCPRCEYNLTGLVEDRCPECGEAFDRELLALGYAAGPRPVPGWDEGIRRPGVAAYLRTCLRIAFRTGDFARRFPWYANADSTRRFRIYSRLLALAVLAFVFGWDAAVHGADGERLLVVGVGMVVGGLIGARVAEEGVAFVCYLFSEGNGPSWVKGCSLELDNWRAYVAYHGFYLALTAGLWVACACDLPSWLWGNAYDLRTMGLLGLPGVWWLGAVLIGVRCRCVVRWRQAVGLLIALPIAVLIGVSIGVFAGVVGGFTAGLFSAIADLV